MIASILHTYACRYRPAGFATVPKGWILLEQGTVGSFPLRCDLPYGQWAHGLIGYEACLEDPERYDLAYQGSAETPDAVRQHRGERDDPEEGAR